MRIVFLGDIVGNTGRRLVRERCQSLKGCYGADIVIGNGENAAGGAGITPNTAEELFSSGVELITTGNHIWNRREILNYLESNRHRICRPLNYAPTCPGTGVIRAVVKSAASGEMKLTVINLAARVFMSELADCPFTALEKVLKDLTPEERGFTIVDFHGEATSEKAALAYHFDGQIDAVLGTHTHVQTADERVLPNGTLFISDVGMCGAYESIIGVELKPVISKFITGISTSFSAATGRGMINGVVLDLGSAPKTIERIRIIEENK